MDAPKRTFGRPLPLAVSMERGKRFFDALTDDIEIDQVLARSKRISKIAYTAATLAGEQLISEGDGDSKKLVYAAYVSLGDITHRTVIEHGSDAAEELLTSNQTHQTLLFASKSLRSHIFDDMTIKYRKAGTHFELNDDGLILQPNYSIPEKDKGKGCPYALGNSQKADYFNQCSDRIVKTYTQAYRQDMPKNITEQLLGTLSAPLRARTPIDSH